MGPKDSPLDTALDSGATLRKTRSPGQSLPLGCHVWELCLDSEPRQGVNHLALGLGTSAFL